jgi:hypothetical protein
VHARARNQLIDQLIARCCCYVEKTIQITKTIAVRRFFAVRKFFSSARVRREQDRQRRQRSRHVMVGVRRARRGQRERRELRASVRKTWFQRDFFADFELKQLVKLKSKDFSIKKIFVWSETEEK